MRIDHIALYVHDLEACRRFFEKYFEAASDEGYHNPATGLRTYFLSFSGGLRLEIMARPEVEGKSDRLMQAGYTHLAFGAGSKAEVDRITECLRKDGYQVLSGPRTTGDGYYESCVLGFEGNQIEITI